MLGKSNAEVPLTAPMGPKLMPSSEYDQALSPVVPVMAIPPTMAPLSTSVMVVVPVP